MGDGACKNEQPAVKFSCLCDLDRPISTEKDGGDRGTGQGGLVQRRVSRHLSAWGERLTDGRRQLADRTLQRVPSYSKQATGSGAARTLRGQPLSH